MITRTHLLIICMLITLNCKAEQPIWRKLITQDLKSKPGWWNPVLNGSKAPTLSDLLDEASVTHLNSIIQDIYFYKKIGDEITEMSSVLNNKKKTGTFAIDFKPYLKQLTPDMISDDFYSERDLKANLQQFVLENIRTQVPKDGTIHAPTHSIHTRPIKKISETLNLES